MSERRVVAVTPVAALAKEILLAIVQAGPADGVGDEEVEAAYTLAECYYRVGEERGWIEKPAPPENW